MPENIIVCEDLWHIYPGEVTALRDANLTITEGEVVGVIGQNGSGKTTLVKHFNGLLKPSRGQVLVNGMDVGSHGTAELSRNVGYVFQNPNHQLFANSVTKEISFGPRNLGLEEREVEEQVEQAIDFFDLEDIRDSHPYRLSFPVRKLVTMAAIYAMQPKIFVLDEPTTGQDHIGVRLVHKLIQKLRETGATVIIVSHDMILQAEATDRLVVLWQAEIIGDGSPREIFSDDQLMERTNLHPPQITQLSRRIYRSGLPEAALRVEELAEPLAKTL
ncbi:MAG: ATP-binding cassette domain-containing protein [Chloroflexota bacterium]|nr:ATP-binding cassette domain-containing protein [Anaerolineae bacterium]